MVHARNFVNDKKYRSECMDWLDYSSSISGERENEARRLDRPLIVQVRFYDITLYDVYDTIL
jgi:hypothetical protein